MHWAPAAGLCHGHQEPRLGLWNAELLRVAGIVARGRFMLAVEGLTADSSEEIVQRAMSFSYMDSAVAGDHCDVPLLVRQVGVVVASM